VIKMIILILFLFPGEANPFDLCTQQKGKNRDLKKLKSG